jgi:hypothetical protein
MEKTTSSSTGGSSPQPPGWFGRNKIWFIVIAIFAVTNSGIYFYQRFQQNKQAEKFAEEMAKKGPLAEDLVRLNNLESVQLLSKSLTWGVRGEMIRGNKELIDRFLIEMVQETPADLIIIGDMNLRVYLSTDKKYEGKPVSEILPAVPVAVNSPKILKNELDEVIAAAPIMGEEEQIGAMFLVYKIDAATEKLLQDIAANPFAKPEKKK